MWQIEQLCERLGAALDLRPGHPVEPPEVRQRLGDGELGVQRQLLHEYMYRQTDRQTDAKSWKGIHARPLFTVDVMRHPRSLSFSLSFK